MNVLRNAIVLIVAVCVSISTATAQVAHVVDQAAVDMVVSDRIAQDEADRATVLRLLSDSQVQTVAGRLGVDMVTARNAVSTLDGPELQTLAAQALQVESALVGGQSTITLSTTTIIIGLLVVLLIIVAVK